MANHSDAMIERLEKEIEERSSFIEGVIAQAQDDGRDLTDNETELTTQARKRIEACDQQLQHLYESRSRTTQARQRAHDVHAEMNRLRNQVDTGPVEYRSAGAWALDSYKAHLGDRDARERLEIFHRVADHQKTGDNPGVVPDPIIGPVVNFIDAARPLVSFIGPQPLTSAKWYRPRVNQRTAVGRQGGETGGLAANEKEELTSQKLTISRLDAVAVTYGGYVNVSRQNIDFSTPQIMDIVINDLAAQYAIETEAALAAELASTNTTAVSFSAVGTGVADALHAAIWEAAATVYSTVRGQGRLGLAVAPDILALAGPLFAPVNPRDAASPGMNAGQFGQGVMGTIGGIPVIMSAGLDDGEAFLFSTAAIEAFEQRVGTLQVTEPSVLGVQVAYAGYFTPLTIHAGGIVPIEADTSTG